MGLGVDEDLSPAVMRKSVHLATKLPSFFGKQMASRAWALGFAAAVVKAFVTDRQPANWGIWERHFKHLKFVPILNYRTFGRDC